MVTMANIKTIEALNLKLKDARHKLKQAEHEQEDIYSEIFGIEENIKDINIKIETEALPTGLYNKGYKLLEREQRFILSNCYGEEVYSFAYSPTLGDLMDAERNILNQISEVSFENTDNHGNTAGNNQVKQDNPEAG